MSEGGELHGFRDRLAKLEFQVEMRPTKDFVQDVADKMLSKAATNDKERNDQLLKLIDERLGAHRSAIITELERDLNSFKSDALKMLERVLHEKLPNAVKDEVDKIERKKKLQVEREQAEREARLQKLKNRITFVGSIIVLLTALVTFYFSFKNQTSPTELRHLDSVGEAITGFQ